MRVMQTNHVPEPSALVRYGGGVAVAAVAGVGTALVMPRGPITPLGVCAALLIGLATGIVVGRVMRSRWAMLVGPVAFVVAVEVTRLPVVGPTVDLPSLDTTFGVLALVLGRGFQGLVQLVPMVLGAAWGAAVARRSRASDPIPQNTQNSRRGAWPTVRRVASAATAMALVALAVYLSVPGTTDPLTDAAGHPIPGGVAEIASVDLGGHDQRVLIRAQDPDAPVLLYLAGGPGQSDVGYTRWYMTEMEQDVVFAVWDQRGAGLSYDALDPGETWTPEQAVSDTIALAEYLRDRFSQDKVYLFGNSWGSLLGILAVDRRPDLFHAYVGAGQMVDPAETDLLLYEDMLDYAAATDDEALAERMRGYGEPPYADINAYGFVVQFYDRLAPYEYTDYFQTEAPPGIDGTGASEYGPLDKVNKEKALLDMAAVLYPQLQDIDARQSIPSLDVPVYLVQGAHELTARNDPAREWFDMLDAPSKQWVEFTDSGHVPQFEEFPRFREFMVEEVIAQAG